MAKSDEIAVIVKSANSTFWQNVRKKGLKLPAKILEDNTKSPSKGRKPETAIDAQVRYGGQRRKPWRGRHRTGCLRPGNVGTGGEKLINCIPVVLIDSGIAVTAKCYQSFHTTDSRAAGKLAAEKLLAESKAAKWQ